MAREQAWKGEGDWLPSSRIVRQWARHVQKLRDGIRNCRRRDDVPLCIVLRAADVSKFLTVSDGDGFVAAGLRIRLLGIDAPEIDQPCQDAKGRDWPCGEKARWRLYELLAGREIEVHIHDVDCYGRLLATCHVGGRDVGEMMVREGLAECYRSDRYKEAENDAVRHRRGIWKGAHQTPESWRRCRRAEEKKADADAAHKVTSDRKKRGLHPARRDLLLAMPASSSTDWMKMNEAFHALLKRARTFGQRKRIP